MDGVDARLDQPLAHLDRVLQRVAGLADVQRAQRVGVLHGADLHLEVEVVADLGPNGLDDVEDEARAVLERAAVFVLAIVDGRAQELRDQVAVGAVQLDAVQPRLARAPRALGEVPDHLLDLGDGHRVALEPVQRIRLAGRRQPARVLDAVDVALPAAVAQLQDELAVVLVDRLADRAPERNLVVVVDHRVVGHDAAAQVHRHERRDDGAHAALGELRLPVDARLVPRAVVVVEAAGDVRPEQPVLDREVPELQRLKDRVESHGAPFQPSRLCQG